MPPKRQATQADEDLSTGDTKKLKPNESAIQDDPPYYIGVALHSKFKVFPESLRRILKNTYRIDLYTNQHALIANTPRASHHQTYQLLKGHRIRSKCLAFSLMSLKSNIASLALANAALMEHLLSERLNLLADAAFSCTETQEGLENPEFLELHSVRVGEIGWGLDDAGALSFYFTKVEGKCLREMVWYVYRREIKVEEEG